MANDVDVADRSLSRHQTAATVEACIPEKDKYSHAPRAIVLHWEGRSTRPSCMLTLCNSEPPRPKGGE